MKKIISVTVVLISVLLLSSCYVKYSSSYNGFTRGEASVAENITELSIEWISGSVTVVYGDTDSVSFSETSSKDIPDIHKLCYMVSGSKLTVAFSKSSNSSIDLKKDLTVTLPKDSTLTSLKVETVSADIYVSDVSVSDKLSLKTVSGKMRASVSGSLELLSLDTISGNAGIESECINELTANTVSGDISVYSGIAPKKATVDSMSGSFELAVPDDAGLTLSFSTISGKLTSDFAVASSETMHVVGSGSSEIVMSSISGNMKLTKLQPGASDKFV